jgi:hypothetical protein
MNTLYSRTIDELSEADRGHLEAILGRALEPRHRVTIAIVSEPEPATRERAGAGVDAILAQVKLPEGVTDEELDAAVREAMNHVRRRD